MYTITAYIIYIILSIFITVYVSRTLSRNGRIFLVDGFSGNEELADSVNHLLVVGFYLVNLGFVLLRMRTGFTIVGTEALIVYLTSNLGVVLLVLGFAHFFNMYVIHKFGRKYIGADERQVRQVPHG